MKKKVKKEEVETKKVVSFRTHGKPGYQPKEKACSKSEDFVANDSVPLNEIIDRFNRGQRLTGVNYDLNPNLIPAKAGAEFDDPDDLYPIRCDDIVDVKEAELDVKRKKDMIAQEVAKLREAQQQAQQQASEQVPT